MLIDESGFMMQPTVRRTWAPQGQTPLLVPSARRDRWSVLTALTVSPERRRLNLYFEGVDHNVRTADIVRFIRDLQAALGRPLLVIWDGLPAHRAAQRQLAELGNGTVFEYFPPYAPQLNPVEYVWAHAKHVHMAGFCPTDQTELGHRLVDTLLATRSKAALLHSFFDHAGLNL